MLQKYEVVVVFDALRGEEENKASLAKLEEVITRNGGVVESKDIWGKRRLAYPIERKRDGYYVVMIVETDSEGGTLPELNRYLRITEEILRFLVTRAVIGKSTGTPPAEDPFEYRNRFQGRRDDRGGRDDRRGGDRPERTERAPREDAPAPSA